MIIENIGIPLPTEIGYLIGRDLEMHKLISYPLLLFLLTLGQVAGSLISYKLGLLGDNYVTKRVAKDAKLKTAHDKLVKWYERYGDLTVFFTRFVGYVRPWSSFVAGFAEVPFWPFIIWTIIGSLIFNALVLYFTGIFLLIWRKYAVLHVYLIIGMFFLFFGVLLYGLARQIWNSRRKKLG